MTLEEFDQSRIGQVVRHEFEQGDLIMQITKLRDTQDYFIAYVEGTVLFDAEGLFDVGDYYMIQREDAQIMTVIG